MNWTSVEAGSVHRGGYIRTPRRRYLCRNEEAGCTLLARMASPARWGDLEMCLTRGSSSLCERFYVALDVFVFSFGGQVTKYRDIFLQSRCQLYAQALENYSAGDLRCCVGCVDGPHIKTALPPSGLQRAVYTGYKRTHGIKFQAITSPDGLLFPLYGPSEARLHDMTLFARSRAETFLQETLMVSETRYYLLGDWAYVLRPFMLVPFRGRSLSLEERNWNEKLSRSRVPLEWCFEDVKL